MTTPMAKRRKEARARSAYQAHVSTFLTPEATKNVFDLTERKLRKLASSHPDGEIRALLTRMLRDYLSGSIAIAWEDGNFPVYSFLKV